MHDIPNCFKNPQLTFSRIAGVDLAYCYSFSDQYHNLIKILKQSFHQNDDDLEILTSRIEI